MIAFILALAVSQPLPKPIKVDAVELNHFHDKRGEHVFSQFVFKRWGNWTDGKRYHVSEWLLLKNKYAHIKRGNRHTILYFHDGQEVLVETPVYRETWTTFDPELQDKNLLPEDRRQPYLSEVLR